MKRNLLAALALTALAAAGAPGTASASTTAGTTILNVVTVQYTDITAANSFSAAASTTVTVNLVKAGLSITTPPSAAAFAQTFNCLAKGDYASGSTFSAPYALTATANGQDTYSLSFSSVASDASSSSATYSLLNADASTMAEAPASVILNSAIVVGNDGIRTLFFPGGSLKDGTQNGLKENDMVVIDYGADGKAAYLVEAVDLGSAATPSQGEDRDSVTLKAFLNNSLGIGDANNAPDFSVAAPAVGTVMGQMALVKIDVTAVAAAKDVNATATYTLAASDGDGNNTQYVGTGAGNTCPAGDFLATKLNILKQVRNWTKNSGGAFAATALSDPGDVLEYLVTVRNEGGQANATTVSDTIPSYTRLVTYATSYGVGAANDTAGYFAEVSDGSGNSVGLTIDASGELAAQPAAPNPVVGYGKATGVAAGQQLNFYLGHGSTSSAGGTVPSCSDATKNTQALCVAPETWRNTYTIMYRVKVD